MTNFLGSIRLAGYAFPLIAALVAVPFFCRQVRARCFNWVRTAFGGLFLFYVLCVLALVFFPLPDAAQAAKLSTYRIQLVPFQFVADFLRETPLVLSDARTYLPALLDRTVLQVVCNILMLMPFGMYLRYVCGLRSRRSRFRRSLSWGSSRGCFSCSAARTACATWTT